MVSKQLYYSTFHIPTVLPELPDNILNIGPQFFRVLAQRSDVRVQGLFERKSKVRVQPGQGGHLPGGPVVIVHNVLVPVGGVEWVVLLRAEPEQGVAVVDVNAEGIDGGDGRVDADVELVPIDYKTNKTAFK